MALEAKYKGILPFLPPRVKKSLLYLSEEFLFGLEEVRLRLLQPILLSHHDRDVYLTEKGSTHHYKTAPVCDEESFCLALNLVTASSLYAMEEEMRRGYVTLPGGHRVGIAGRALLDKGHIKGQRDIASLNYRIARAVEGAGEKLLPCLYENGVFLNTLVISPPRCGKTTLLRDLTRILSDGTAITPSNNIGLVDERSEIAGSLLGKAQLQVGHRTDILDAVPKAEGMMMMIRSMAPEIIVSDEIGSGEDGIAVMEAVNSGIHLLLSAHGRNIGEIRQRPVLAKLLEMEIFQRMIVLSREKGPGTIQGIYDGKGHLLPERRVRL